MQRMPSELRTDGQIYGQKDRHGRTDEHMDKRTDTGGRTNIRTDTAGQTYGQKDRHGRTDEHTDRHERTNIRRGTDGRTYGQTVTDGQTRLDRQTDTA